MSTSLISKSRSFGLFDGANVTLIGQLANVVTHSSNCFMRMGRPAVGDSFRS